MTAADFLGHLYANTDTGWLTLFSVDRVTGEKPIRWTEIGEPGTAAQQAAELAATGCVWFGVAPRAERLTGGRRGGAADCLTIPALWLDVDVRSDAHASEQLPETLADALALLEEFPLPATAVVDSGHGLQAWWQLSEPLPADAATTLLADWGATWAQLGDRHGWHVDNVFDLARVMRLPGTWNRKSEPKLVTILSQDWDRTYGVDDIDGHLIAAPTPTPSAATRRDLPYIGPERPGDAYNAVADPGAILERAGCHFDHSTPDGARHYRAPHRTKTTETTGATVYPDGHTTIWSETFATSSGMQVRRPYDAYGLYAHIEHRGDWQSATRALRASGYGADVVDDWERSVPISGSAEARESVAQPPGQWLDPIPLGMADELPEFPVETLPEWIAEQVYAVADELQMPPDLPAIMALTCLAAICAKRTRVKVRGGWNEPLNIYAAVAMPPSAGKSPAFSLMMAPLKAHEKAEIERRTVEIAKAEQAHRMKEKALKKAEESGDEHEAQRLLTELLALDKPASPRMIADDATPEALTSLLADHDGRIALLSTEGGVFDLMTGRYSDRANLDVYLKAWGGDDITVDRIGRGPSAVASPALTIGVTVQPSVISALAERPELAGRGLTARFMYALPVDTVGRRNFIDQPEADPAIAAAYSAQMMQVAATVEHRGDLNILALDAEASAMFHRWRQAMERRRLPGADMRPIAEWSTKLESTTLRVAGLLHLADGGRLHDTVTSDPMARAIEIGDYWLAHAFAVHDMWGADPVLLKARAIMEWAAGRETFTVRDVYSAMRRSYPKADDTVPPLSLLVERGWLRPVDNEWPPVLGRRGVSSPILEVHPEVARHARHARANSAKSDAKTSKGARHARHAPKGISEDYLLTSSEHSETPPRAHDTHGAHLYPQAPPETLAPTGTDPEPFRPF